MHKLSAGMKFNRLTVVKRAPHEPRFHGCYGWVCRCDCGTLVTVVSRNLVKGISRSCGCLLRDVMSERNRTHGLTHTRAYRAWQEAKRRCYDPRRRSYGRYGGRGITMYDEWRNSFAAFLRDVGPCPPGLSIDRIDNSNGYEPGNVRWTNATVQSNNRHNITAITFRGETMSLTNWARRLGIKRLLLHKRLKRGWPVDLAFTTPPKKGPFRPHL